jgi:riboflavin transporter 2
MPYMAAFHPNYLTAYFVGMGLSSLVPSIVALGQGTIQYKCVLNNTTGTIHPEFTPARFQIREYTLIMGIWMAITLTAFCILHYLHRRMEEKGTEQESSPLRVSKSSIAYDVWELDALLMWHLVSSYPFNLHHRQRIKILAG